MTENLNLKTVTTVDTRPFRKLVMTIGELPTSFIESMTYYELLAWFTNYLETVIIPTVNNNGEAVEELQDKYVELKTNTEQEISTFENEITTAFNTLKDYVDTYFDNLDVQEEINNKLDNMAEAGTLQEIITQYINSTALWMFDNVASMKLATNFVDGSFAKTLGFYARDDKGGATYKIRSKTAGDTADEMTLIALADTTLIAELVLTPCMNVKQFGAKGDGVADDTAKIQAALDNSSTVSVPEGTYMVNAVTHIIPNSNNKIILDNDATIKAITNNETTYAVIYLDDVDNVEISGGTIQGDRLTHTDTEGEWGHCIMVVNGCSNLFIHDIVLSNAWGDGIYFNNCDNVRTTNVKVNNARRNGYSLISLTNYISTNDTVNGTNGTAPSAGVDIEPNEDTEVLSNITFNNFTSTNNQAAGFQFYFVRNNTVPYDITLNNYHCDTNSRGIYYYNNGNSKANVYLNEPQIKNSTTQGIFGITVNNAMNNVYINRPFIDKYAISGLKQEGIHFETLANAEGGNVYITEPTILHTQGTNTSAIRIDSRGVSYPWHTALIRNPINLDGLPIEGDYGDMQFIDDTNVLSFNATENVALDSLYHSLCTNTGAAASVRFLLAEATTFKNEVITFRVTEAQNITVFFRNQNIHPLSTAAGQTVTLSGVGSSITVKKINATDWILLNSVGTITIA